MTCSPGDPCFPKSILGENIYGRSTAGHDIRERPTVYSRLQGQAQNGTIDYYPGAIGLTPQEQKYKHMGQFDMNNPGIPTASAYGRGGMPLTDTQRMQRHQMLYGNTNLPPRGTGLAGRTGGMGVPLTDTQRMQRHQMLYGTTQLPPRGTGRGINMGPGVYKFEWDFNSILAGCIIGFIIGALLLTGTGRGILYRGGQRVAKGPKKKRKSEREYAYY